MKRKKKKQIGKEICLFPLSPPWEKGIFLFSSLKEKYKLKTKQNRDGNKLVILPCVPIGFNFDLETNTKKVGIKNKNK